MDDHFDTRSWRHERRSNRFVSKTAILLAIARMPPRDVYGGLLRHAQSKGSKKAAGWTSHMFKEIYGTWPRPQDKGPPTEPTTELQKWIAMRPKRSKR